MSVCVREREWETTAIISIRLYFHFLVVLSAPSDSVCVRAAGKTTRATIFYAIWTAEGIKHVVMPAQHTHTHTQTKRLSVCVCVFVSGCRHTGAHLQKEKWVCCRVLIFLPLPLDDIS